MNKPSAESVQSGDVSLTDFVRSTLNGMKATLHEAMSAEVTENYPEQQPQLPWGTKAQLYVDILECISCFKCATICPTDCIRIDAVRAPAATLGDSSDGHKRMFEVVRFDIDMAQCCYCGLCTGRSSYVPADKKNDPAALAFADKAAVCPTDCINFYPRFENGTEAAGNMLYHFSNYSFEEAVQRWNAVPVNMRRTTHAGAPERDYVSADIQAVEAPKRADSGEPPEDAT